MSPFAGDPGLCPVEPDAILTASVAETCNVVAGLAVPIPTLLFDTSRANKFVSNAKSDDYFGNKRINQEKFWIRKIIKEEIGNRKFKLLASENRLYKIEKEVINYKKNIFQIIKSL